MELQQEEEDLRMAMRMSLQSSPSESKRSMPPEDAEESPEARGRRLRREIMAAAAERRMAVSSRQISLVSPEAKSSTVEDRVGGDIAAAACLPSTIINAEHNLGGQSSARKADGDELNLEEANRIFLMLFGGAVSKNILTQWTNQGIRFSSDPDTCMGLVQHKGGPCGVLAPIQAFILKYLLFLPSELDKDYPSVLQPEFDHGRLPEFDFSNITDIRKRRALVLSMVEILFSCGNKKRAVVATLTVIPDDPADQLTGEEPGTTLEGVSLESGSDLNKYLRVKMHESTVNAYNHLMEALPVFESRMGAVLFLISALLSRGLESVQGDRDDPSLPLVTSPFGHASQEIVNMLICGEAAANVFDGRMDLGGGMFLKGIPGEVEVGFLTLLESLNYCKVGSFLKRPRWPIWVLGSESHYTVLFALSPSVQSDAAADRRAAAIRSAFDAHDQSGGGGFVAAAAFPTVLHTAAVDLPADRLDALCAAGYVVWSDFWKVLAELEESRGGLKEEELGGKKRFELYHFNGIAKSMGGTTQRPRLCRLRVSVPPEWTQEEFMTNGGGGAASSGNNSTQKEEDEADMRAPVVDCIRTRWSRAICSWIGDPPSIV